MMWNVKISLPESEDEFIELAVEGWVAYDKMIKDVANFLKIYKKNGKKEKLAEKMEFYSIECAALLSGASLDRIGKYSGLIGDSRVELVLKIKPGVEIDSIS